MKSESKGFTLIEMILAICILAVLAVGVLKLFVNSRVTHQKAFDLDNAVLETNRLIEEFQSVGGAPRNESRFTVYYDEQWNPATLDDDAACYAIYGNIAPLSEEQGGLLHLDLRAVRIKPYPFEEDEQTEIYSVSTIIEDQSFWGGSNE
ncbi:MAG TPA: prepilin-type N-terminal cleavage/methylation domain-containing protein [Clostridiaceae bacterium]|nr:prepilin-type N-terminal cleavage/methylation domain-containing protein [Clostridiaceae bacterium]